MSSTVLQPCTDLTDIVPLSAAANLYLKPVARVTVAVQLPKSLSSSASRPGAVGKSISNWEVMEKVKLLARPIVFSVMKVTTSTLEFIRYEGEVDNKDMMLQVIHALDNQTIKLSGYSEVLRVACVEAKLNFPQRHDWTAFFRDAQNLNELQPGERPDTVILQNLPCKWFAETDSSQPNTVTTTTPSSVRLREVFEAYGAIRAIDIPLLDPCRNSARPNGVTSTFLTLGHELVFDAFIQYSVYNSFVTCLTSLSGMKLMHKESEEKVLTANIKVEFDRTQHMSDKNRRKRRHARIEFRRLEKERELKAQCEKEQAEERRKAEEQKVAEEAKLLEAKRKEREERRRQRRALKVEKAERRREAQEEKQRQRELALEERKLLIAQRQLESIRLLSYLFDRIKEKRLVELVELERIRQEEEDLRHKLEERQSEVAKAAEFRDMLTKKEEELRNALLKTKRHEERKRKKQEEKRLKKIKRREKMLQKNLKDGVFKLPKITPHLQRFLDDLPILPILPVAPVEAAVEDSITIFNIPAHQEPAACAPPRARPRSNVTQRPRIEPPSSSTVIPAKRCLPSPRKAQDAKSSRNVNKMARSAAPQEEVRNVVLVVPSDHAGKKLPLFTTPKNILFC